MGGRASDRALSSWARGASLPLASLLLCCAAPVRQLPPHGEVMVVVDTDMPVPRLLSRLRIDLYTADGAWYASRDLSRAALTDWPTSFGLYLTDPLKAQSTLVRLRGYPEGEVRDYRGERYAPRPTAGEPLEEAPAPPPTDEPRFVREDGSDATPRYEPSPLVTIDRLVRVRIEPHVRRAARVVLRGACVGTMADVAGARTCVDTENDLVPVADEPTTPETSLPAASEVGTFAPRRPCTATPRPPGAAADGTPLHDEEVCVDGNIFVFGSSLGFGVAELDSLPKRVAILPPFRLDRYEVTVARWRAALAQGFRPPANAGPRANDGPLVTESSTPEDPRACTWSTAPRGREDYPVNCLPHRGARAFCQWLGGELPTEAQWEYAALHAGRPAPTAFPFGGDPTRAATCDDAVLGRGPYPGTDQCNPDGKSFGPLPIGPRRAIATGDTSLGLGIVDLTGNVAEYVRDAAAPFTANCWQSQPLASPACLLEGAATYVLRGAHWLQSRDLVYGAMRTGLPSSTSTSQTGFRCARPGS